MSGNLNFHDSDIHLVDKTIAVGTALSNAQWHSSYISFYDKNSTRTGFINVIYNKDGSCEMRADVYNKGPFSVNGNKVAYASDLSALSTKLSNIGKQYWSGVKTLSSLKEATGTEFAPLTLDPGCYIIKAAAQFTNIPDGTLLYVSLEGIDCFYGERCQSITASAGDADMGVTMHVSLTSKTTVKTRVWSRVDLSGTIYGETSAMRII